MLTYDMDGRGGASLYEHLYRCIRGDILSGALPAGEKLPSRRRLAEHLNVSVMTVEGAYRQLEAEGYLTAWPRRPCRIRIVITSDLRIVKPRIPIHKLLAVNGIQVFERRNDIFARLYTDVIFQGFPLVLVTVCYHKNLPSVAFLAIK